MIRFTYQQALVLLMSARGWGGVCHGTVEQRMLRIAQYAQHAVDEETV
jgi:hypothetical protein